MKTTGFILAIGLLITASASVKAQTQKELKPDSVRIGYNLSQKILNDTLKLENPVQANKLQYRKFNYELPMQKLNFTGSYGFSTPHTPDNMPVTRLNIESNMPVLRPDPSVHYFIQTKKIGE